MLPCGQNSTCVLFVTNRSGTHEAFYTEQKELWETEFLDQLLWQEDRFSNMYPEWKCRLHPELVLLKRMDLKEGGLEGPMPDWVKECLEYQLPLRFVSIDFLQLKGWASRDFQRYLVNVMEKYLRSVGPSDDTFKFIRATMKRKRDE